MFGTLLARLPSARSLPDLCAALDDEESGLTLAVARDHLARYDGDDWKTLLPAVSSTERPVVDVARTPTYAIVLIQWGRLNLWETTIHNHPRKGAAIRILAGRLTEERFSPIGDYGKVLQTHTAQTMETGATWSLTNSEGTHRLSVGDHTATTLHIYLPGRQQCQSAWCGPP